MNILMENFFIRKNLDLLYYFHFSPKISRQYHALWHVNMTKTKRYIVQTIDLCIHAIAYIHVVQKISIKINL